MLRADKDLSFILQYENIAWYENGAVRILDRRVYPSVLSFVECTTYLEVKKAISDMVTQSAGPYTAAAMGMALAGYECRNLKKLEQFEFLKKASFELARARPTTIDRMSFITKGCLDVAIKCIECGQSVCEGVRDFAINSNNIRYNKINKAAKFLLDKIPSEGKIITQCYGETIIGMLAKEGIIQNKHFKVYCAETRPYFQGARLTASVFQDMGYDTTVITDNMPAFAIKNLNIDLFTSASDAICLDGNVVNKVGTYQIAIVSKYLGIPFYVSGIPDKGHKTVDTVKIEMRDSNFVLQAMGVKTTMEGVKGYYPSFDITPPELVTGVVTDFGVFSPYELASYFEVAPIKENEIII